MTQTTNGIEYPIEPILLVRPCHVKMCLEVRPAAKLLSALLYHARNCTDDTFDLYRTQSDLVHIDMIDEVCEKTLCDVAAPMLQLLGFLDIDASSYVIHYSLHMDRIREAIEAYKQDIKAGISRVFSKLAKTLIGFLHRKQLELVLIKSQIELVLKELETVLITGAWNKNQFYKQLEPILIRIRTSSNVKRGRKPSPEAAREPQKQSTENKRDNGEIDTRESKRDSSSANADEIAMRYEKGHAAIQRPHQDIISMTSLLTAKDDAFLAEMEKMLPPADFSTPLPHTVDNDTMSHSHVVQATRNEGEDDGTDTQHSRDNSAGRLRTGPLLPISGGSGLHHDSPPEGYQESAQRRGRLEAAPLQEQPHAVQNALQVGATNTAPAKETRKRGVGKKAPDAIDITVEGMEVYRAWCSLFKVTVPLNKAIAKAANELVEPLAVWSVVKGCTHKEILKSIKDWLYENDKNGYYSRGVKLYDIAREFEGWQSKQEQPQSMNGTGKKYKPSPDEELVEWQGQWMTEEEANKLGFNGGFGAYI